MLTKTKLKTTAEATTQVLRPSINPQVPAARKPEEAASHFKVAVLKAQAPEDLEVGPVLSPPKTQGWSPIPDHGLWRSEDSRGERQAALQCHSNAHTTRAPIVAHQLVCAKM